MLSPSHLATHLILYTTLLLSAHGESIPNLRNAGLTAQIPLESLLPLAYQPAFDQRTTTTTAYHNQALRRAQTLASCQPQNTACTAGGGCCPVKHACGFRTMQGSTIGVCEATTCVPGAARCSHPFTACCPQTGMTCGSDGTCSISHSTPMPVPRPPKGAGGGSPASASPTTTPVKPTIRPAGGGPASKSSGVRPPAKSGGHGSPAKNGGGSNGESATGGGSNNSGFTAAGLIVLAFTAAVGSFLL